jgi:hypothetical protein
MLQRVLEFPGMGFFKKFEAATIAPTNPSSENPSFVTTPYVRVVGGALDEQLIECLPHAKKKSIQES